MRHLPPLRAIRAFEACYRLGSFTRAAAELNVGQPAVSHQIKLLEEDLGVVLFEKRGPLTRPSAIADDYYRSVALALSGLDDASRKLRRLGRDDIVTIGTYPGIANFWALPRLSAQGQATAYRVVTAERDADLDLADLDAAILFGAGDWPGFEARKLIGEAVVPVAAPALAQRLRSLTPADLLAQGPLIHLEDTEARWFTWQDWQGRFAPEAASFDRSLLVTNHGIALYQAIQGQGVALGWRGVVDDLLASGVLIALHDTPLTSARGYYLVSRPGWSQGKAGRHLLDLLLAPAQIGAQIGTQIGTGIGVPSGARVGA